MFKILEYKKEGQASKIWIQEEGSQELRMQFIRDGMLEAYMGAYRLTAVEALLLLLADGHVDGLDCPEITDPDYIKKVAKLLKKAPNFFDWSAVDRNQMLADITLADDVAADMVQLWADGTEAALSEVAMTTISELNEELLSRSATYASGHEQRQQEIQADEIMSSMPAGEIRAPRSGGQEPPTSQVGWAIKLVE